MLPLSDLFVQVYVVVDEAIQRGAVPIPRRPGPAPACSDAEVLTLAVVRQLLGHRSERAFLADVRRDWGHYFPRVPSQSQFNRRVRWLWGAFEHLRAQMLAAVPPDPWQQVDTTALPVKHPSRHRGPEHWDGPDELRADFGRDASHAEWFFGFRPAVRTDLGSRLVRAWAIVPPAGDERAVADGLLDGGRCTGLLLDRGFIGRAWAAEYAARGITVVLAPGRAQRRQLSRAVRRPVAALRNRIETTIGELTDVVGLNLARHGAKSFWGLLTRTAATVLAHTLLRLAYV
jgi:Transposase DDE domain